MQHTINKTFKKEKKLVRKSGKTIKLSIQTLQMLHLALTLNISETTQDRAIVNIERQYEIICALSYVIFNDLDRPVTKFSRSRHI